MALYMTTAAVTPEYATGLMENPVDREDALRALVEAVGGRWVALYFAPQDGVVHTLAEFDDEAAGDTILFRALAGGGLAPGTMRVSRIVTGAGLADIAARAAGVSYSVPGRG